MIEKLRAALEDAAKKDQKTAMFHFQVLLHAAELEGVDPLTCCRELGLRDSYAVEFRKMIAAARVMREQGYALTPRRA